MARADTAYLAQWKPLARMRTHEQVVAEIENRLMTGRLKAGDRLPPERQFAEILGVGRGAVREALRILEAVGIIEASAGSGPSAGSVIVKDSVSGLAMVLRLHLQVASFSQEDLVEVQSLIERLAVRNAAASATDEDIAELRSLAVQIREAQTPIVFHSLEAAFHVRLVQVSDNALATVLMAALQQAQLHTATDLIDDADSASRMQVLAGQYCDIVTALAERDGDVVAELLARNLRGMRATAAPRGLKRAG